jgi:hypothetical protein
LRWSCAVDLVTFAALAAVEGDALLAAVRATFSARAGHMLPSHLPDPPDAWATPYARLAGESLLLPVTDLQAGFTLAVTFWQPVLDETAVGRHWDPRNREWVGDS